MLDIHQGQIFEGTQQSSAASSVAPKRTSSMRAGVYTLVKNAEILAAHQEYHLAANLLKQACNLDSKSGYLLTKLAGLLEQNKAYEEALRIRKQVVRQDYKFESIYQLAQLYYKMEKDEESLQSYYEALSLVEDSREELFEIHKNIGNIYVRSGDFDSAEENYNRAYRLNPKSDTLLVNFGTLEVQRGDLENALLRFRRAIELNPKNDRAWAGLSMVHNEYADHELAWGNILTALDINPRNRTAVIISANWASRDKDPGKAIAFVQNYLSLSDFDIEVSFVSVNLLCMAGEFVAARIEIERILAISPGHKEAMLVREQLNSAIAGIK